MRSSKLVLAQCAGMLLAAVAGCRSTTDAVTSPANRAPAADQLRIAAGPLSVQCAEPGQLLQTGPSVTVSDAQARPVSGVLVTFVAAGGGSLDRSSAVTDRDGVASAGAWRLAAQAGANSVLATIAGGPGVTFTITSAVAARVVAIYDLVSIAGAQLPVTFPAMGSVTGGHYVLGDNGTYLFAYDRDGQAFTPPTSVCSSARYVVSGSGIEFYLAPDTYPMSRFYQERNGHFATASLSGPTMSVKYDDFVDFDDEVYRLDGATSNAFAQVDAGGR